VFPIRSGALEFNQHSTAVVDSLCISNVFDTVIARHNTKLYVRFTDATAGTRVDKVVELAPGDYTLTSLVAELQTKLQAAMPTTGDFVSAVLTVTKIGDSKLRIAIAGANLVGTATRVEILTFAQLRLGVSWLNPAWTGTGADAIDFTDLQDACAVCGFNLGLAFCADSTHSTSQHVSFQAYRNLYLHCSSEAESIGPRGESSVILQVVVGNTTRGDIITLNESYTAAPVSLPTAVSELRFQLKDVTGKTIDLEGHDMSFALVAQ
jgi:hypothetical protein